MGYVVDQVSVCGRGQNSALRRSTHGAKSCERDYKPTRHPDHKQILCPDRCQARLGHVSEAALWPDQVWLVVHWTSAQSRPDFDL